MAKLKGIGVLSSATMLAAIMAIIGLIAGILYSIGGLIYDVFTIGLNGGTALAFLALIGMPITFAIPGFIVGAIGAFIYNLVAGWVGGIEMDFEQ
jgi:Ca2+/H+ antiporter